MRTLLIVASAAALTLGASAPGGAAGTSAPVRVLLYDVRYSAHTTSETKSSGFTSGPPTVMSSKASHRDLSGATLGSVTSGEGTEARVLDGTDHGTLTVEVVAAPADGGLVVDVSFNGEKIVQPRVRVAVLSDGRLSADPAHPLCPEAIRVLPLLARGFVADRDVTPGATWTTESGAPVRGALTYRVSRLDGDQATIGFEGSFTGAAGAESDSGSTVYATEMLSPVSLDLTTVTRRQVAIDTIQTTTAHVTAALLSDSFPKRGR